MEQVAQRSRVASHTGEIQELSEHDIMPGMAQLGQGGWTR